MSEYYNNRIIANKSNLIMPSSEACEAQRLVATLLKEPASVDNFALINAFGFFLFDKNDCINRGLRSVFNCNFRPDLDSNLYVEIRDRILNLFNYNAFFFLRSGLSLICDYTQFSSTIDSCGFNYKDKQIASLALVALILKAEIYPLDSASFIKINSSLNEAGYHNSMTFQHLERIVQSLLDWQFQGSSNVKKKQALIKKSEDSSSAISDIIKHELAITSLEDQLKAVCLSYSNQGKAGKDILVLLRQNLISMPFSKRTEQEKIKTCEDIMSMIQYTEPLDFLCCFARDKNYVYKRQYSGKVIRGKTESRKTDANLECGIAFSIFSSAIKKDDHLLIVFPSPRFIRKWTTDPMLADIKTCFIVQSEYENELLSYQFGGKLDTKKYPKVENITIKTITNIEQDKDLFYQSYTKAIVFAGQHELYQKKRNNTDENVIPETEMVCSEDLIRVKNYIIESSSIEKVFCLCSDFSFYDKVFFSRSIVETNIFSLNTIFLLPEHLPDVATPQKKCFWIAERSEANANVKIIRTSFIPQHESKYSAITQLEPAKTFCWEDFLKGNITLRKSYSNIGSDETELNFKPTDIEVTNRSRSEEIRLTNEIIAYYTKSYLHKLGKYRIYVYLKDDKNRKITASIRQKDFGINEDYKTWIITKYPIAHKYSRDANALVKTEISDIIVNTYCERFGNKSISFKSLLYVYKKQILDETDLSEDKLKLAKLLILTNENLGDPVISEVSADTISECILNEQSFSNSDKNACIEAFSLLLDFAVKNGNCSENEFADVAQGRKRESAMTSLLRSTLTQKTFSKAEDQKLLMYIKSNLTQDNTYIGVLIKFLTGLETSVILALRWEDFYRLDRFDFYQLHIYQQYSQRQKDIVTLKNLTDYRCIPCSPTLAEALIALHQKRKKTKGFKETNFIVSDPETNGKDPIPNDVLRRKIKDSIRFIKCINDADINYESNDITREWYSGDFLRENFRYMATDFANFNSDEVAYILGNKTETTAAQHYIDFKNELSQLLLYVKMRRIDVAISNYEEFFSEPQRGTLTNGTDNVIDKNNCQNPLYVNIVSRKSTGATSFAIKATAKYGLDVQVATSKQQ